MHAFRSPDATRATVGWLAPIVAVLLALHAPMLLAQDSPSAVVARSGWAVGASLGKLRADGWIAGGMAVGVSAAQVRPGRVGADVWVGTAFQ